MSQDSFISLLLLLLNFCQLFGSSWSLPEGYEYAWAQFGEAQPITLQPKVVLASGDQFGKQVALWNGIAAVASNEISVDSTSGQTGMIGKVFLFHQNYMLNWVNSNQYFSTRLTGDGFGSSLALYDGLLVVGAPQDSSMGENRGLAYIYSGDGFASSTSISPSEHADNNDYFGSSVAITRGFNNYYGGSVVVGAYGHNKDKEHEAVGCVFVFALDDTVWTQVGFIEPSFPVNHGGFGYSLASYGNNIVVGSYGSEHVHVFELHGDLHECPHEDPEHHKEDFPAECLEDDTNDDYNPNQYEETYDDDEQRRLLRHRILQPELEEKKFYHEWRYQEELLIGFPTQEHHAPEDKDSIQHFGASVSIYNNSGLMTIAVGCTMCVTSNNVEVGAVYIFSKLNQNDVVVGWYPDDYHPKEEEPPKRQLQEGEHDEHKFLWDPEEHSSHASKTGEYWIKENSFTGRIQYEKFGYSVSIDGGNLLVGTNPGTSIKGRAEVYSRKTSSNSYDFVRSGPLYNTIWRWSSNLQDTSGITGDRFGFSVALDGGVAVVGSILGGQLDDGSFGTGAAYVYQRKYVRKIKTQETGNNDENSKDSSMMEELSDTHTVLGVFFVTIISVLGFSVTLALFYGVYRVSGGESSPRKLMIDLFGLDNSDMNRASRSIRLTSAMDDSTTSVGSSASSQRGFIARQSNSSAYSGLSTSSAHGRPTPYQSRPQYVPKGPPKPTYSPAKNKNRGLDDL